MENIGIMTKESTQNDKYIWIDKIILVAEDIDLNFLYISELLKPTGTMIIHAINGKDAVELCQKELNIDLVLMDIYMPIMNGYEATRQIRAMEMNNLTTISQPTKIIALTASAFEEQRTYILSIGCDDFIRKPFREEFLLNKLAEHLGVKYIYAETTKDGGTKEERSPSLRSAHRPRRLSLA